MYDFPTLRYWGVDGRYPTTFALGECMRTGCGEMITMLTNTCVEARKCTKSDYVIKQTIHMGMKLLPRQRHSLAWHPRS